MCLNFRKTFKRLRKFIMGNAMVHSSDSELEIRSSNYSSGKDRTGIRLFLHRTWAVMVTEKLTRTRIRMTCRTQISDDCCVSDYSQYSEYSKCSCDLCLRDDGFSSGGYSEIFDSLSTMAPNSEESTRIGLPFLDDLSKEKQRPPIYNPEDYAISLKKWGRKSTNGNNFLSLYGNNINTGSMVDLDGSHHHHRTQSNSYRDYRNPMLLSTGSEMTLRQFGTVSELLTKLKSDLRLAYPSFVQEFVADPLDGITLLLDVLRAIHLSQSGNNGQNPGGNNTTGKIPPAVQRRALLDELSCLQCLLNCCIRYSEATRKLTASSAGLFTLAVCIMSNVNKSRIIALQLLTMACDASIPNGFASVSEALSTLRLRFGEPVRFRFLVGMLTSAIGQKDLLSAGLKFLNTFVEAAGSQQKRLYIQAELEQAGFDITAIKKNIGSNINNCELILEELDRWEKNHIDIESMLIRMEDAEKENDSLRDKILLLERRVQILQEEKGILLSLEKCLKDRCSELQGEVHSLKSSSKSLKKDGSNPAEDEGISSSERSLTPETNLQRDSSVYELYQTLPATKLKTKLDKKSDDDEETTIDEVIEELRNIINDAETETYKIDRKREAAERRKIEEAQIAGKFQIKIDIDDYALDNESEIVPSNLHPQPPRKARSLVHLFMPNDFDYVNKELFFENETAYTSEEGSDSLLSASKLPRVEKIDNKVIVGINYDDHRASRRRCSIKRAESFRHVNKIQTNSIDSVFYYNQEQTHLTIKNSKEETKKSKSLDRIDDGLDSMIDIVTVSTNNNKSNPFSHIFNNPMATMKREKSINSSEEKQKMFLPVTSRDSSEIPYYFPRVQEKRSSTSSSFLIKRGHANAGLYSGQILTREINLHDSLGNNSSLSQNSKTKSSKFSGKVTDYPSGLY